MYWTVFGTVTVREEQISVRRSIRRFISLSLSTGGNVKVTGLPLRDGSDISLSDTHRTSFDENCDTGSVFFT